MIGPYTVGCDVGALSDWPFDNPASNYEVTRGTPRASGRIDMGGPGHMTRFGIWRCTAGAFTCTEQGDEMMTVLSGHCTITDHGTDASVNLSPGDSLFISGDSRVTWDVTADVTKVFHGYKTDGY